jgi:hypothetical protein
VFAFFHYNIKKDVATPIIGTALLFSGLMDAFHVLAADKLILYVSDNEHFIPFTWAMSRIFHAVILTAGTGMFVWRNERAGPPKPRGVRFIILVSILYGLVAYLLIQICASPQFAADHFPGAFPRRMMGSPDGSLRRRRSVSAVSSPASKFLLARAAGQPAALFVVPIIRRVCVGYTVR